MTAPKRIEIRCPGCGQDSLLVREPKYEGFTRVDDALRCAACGHRFASEDEVPFRHGSQPKVFSESDRSEVVKVFEQGEADQLCRFCVHYVVNPFMQWCGMHKKEVEATDSCGHFKRKPDPPPTQVPPPPERKPIL
jgi:DNA-directed RNA polymerase subunit RPC12/RpoP